MVTLHIEEILFNNICETLHVSSHFLNLYYALISCDQALRMVHIAIYLVVFFCVCVCVFVVVIS